MPPDSCVIVGASMAGGRAAEALRDSGYDGAILLIGAEPERPYERPPLSKQYLRREMPEEKLYLRPASYYGERRIELRLGARATRLDPAANLVELESGELLPYHKLLIATGCDVRRLAIPGADLPGAHYLRTRADAEALADALGKVQRVVVIGAGFIGSEVAASARMLSREVTLLEAAPIPLARALGTSMGEVCAAIHREQGVELRLACGVNALRGSGRIEEVALSDGGTLPCDMAVIGVGVAPSVGWLEDSGIALDNGVVVNEFCETNLPGIYAAGDIANSWNPLFGERLRVEHYENARNQGIAAGKAMAGVREPYAPIPYFWSDQYEHTLQYVGHARGDDEMVLRGDPATRSFTAFYLRGSRLRAAFAIGRPRDIMAARRLIQSGREVDPGVLADEQTDLRALSRA